MTSIAPPGLSDSDVSPTHSSPLVIMAVGALGVVFGDIGTSPLYTLKTAFDFLHGEPTPDRVIGMLSLRIKGGEASAVATAARVKIWKRATSLGGVESLIEHRASVEGPHSPCPPDLLRRSVGLEDVADLIGDLDQALG